jgi:hypothetical protein
VQDVCLDDDYFSHLFLILLFDGAQLRGTADQDGLFAKPIEFLHEEVETVDFTQSGYEVMDILGELFRVCNDHDYGFFLAVKLLETDQNHSQHFA